MGIVRIKGPVRGGHELRFVDATTNLAFDTTGTIAALNLVAQGNDYSSRQGRLVKAMKISLRGYGNATATTGLGSKNRILLVWDNAVNGVLPAITDILVTASTNSFVNVSNQNRFTILWDHSFVTGVYSLTATQSVASEIFKMFEAEMSLSSDVQYGGTGGTIASIQNGALYVVSVGVLAAGGTAPSGQCTTRFRFMDLD